MMMMMINGSLPALPQFHLEFQDYQLQQIIVFTTLQ